MSRASLTRRQSSLYEAVIRGEETRHYYNHAWAGSWGSWSEVGAAWQAALFAAEFGGRKGVDVGRLEDIVLEGGDVRCAYFFARRVRGADVGRLRRFVESSGHGPTIAMFLRHVPDARKA